jgi:DNA-binding NarL/FixJ family response regulator
MKFQNGFPVEKNKIAIASQNRWARERAAEKKSTYHPIHSTPLTQHRDRILAGVPALTLKEVEVAHLLLKGLSTADMAHIAGNSDKTLKQHISTIYEKCGVSSRAEFFFFIFPT